jgi:hypothetical protein
MRSRARRRSRIARDSRSIVSSSPAGVSRELSAKGVYRWYVWRPVSMHGRAASTDNCSARGRSPYAKAPCWYSVRSSLAT